MNNTKSKVNKETLQADLRRFTGSERPRRYSVLFPLLHLTDGARHLADHGYYWFMDLIGSCQMIPEIAMDPMLEQIQFWRLEVKKDGSAVVRCERDQDDIVYLQKIPDTDSILDSVLVYLQPLYLSPFDNNHEGKQVILLPSEY